MNTTTTSGQSSLNQLPTAETAATEVMPDSNSVIENYFERVNTEYRQSVLSGRHSESTMPEILERNKEGFFNLVADFWESPLEAIKYIGTRAFELIAGSWIAEVTGILAPLRAMQERVLGLIENPFGVISEVIDSIKNIPGLSNLDFSTEATLERSLVLVSAVGIDTGLITDFGKIFRHLRDNPEISRNATDNDMKSEAWWGQIFDQLGISQENRIKLLPVVTGQMAVSRILGNTNERHTQNESDVEYQSEMVSLSEFAQRRMEGFVGILNNFKNSLGEAFNRDPFLVGTVGALIGYLARGPIIFTASTGIKSIGLLLGLAKIGVLTTTRSAFRHPFGTAILGMLALAVTLKTTQNLSDARIPSDPNEALDWMRRKLVNDPTWNRIIEELPPEIQATADVALEYAAGVRDFSDLIIDNAQELAAEIGDSAVEAISMSNEELIRDANQAGLGSLSYFLGYEENSSSLNQEQLEEFNYKLQEIILNLDLGQNFTQQDIEQLRLKAAPLNIVITQDQETGHYLWSAKNANNEFTLPEILCIDPALSSEQQLAAAHEVRDGTLTGYINELRNKFTDAEGNQIETFEQATDYLKEQITLGNAIYVVGVKTFLNGVLLGPIEIWGGVIDSVLNDQSFSADMHDMAIDYLEGVVPIVLIAGPTFSLINLKNGVNMPMIKGFGSAVTMPLRYSVKIPYVVGRSLLQRRYRAQVVDAFMNNNRYSSAFINQTIGRIDSINNIARGSADVNRLYNLERYLRNHEGVLRHIGLGRPNLNTQEFISTLNNHLEELRVRGIDLGVSVPRTVEDYRNLQALVNDKLKAFSNFTFTESRINLPSNAQTTRATTPNVANASTVNPQTARATNAVSSTNVARNRNIANQATNLGSSRPRLRRAGRAALITGGLALLYGSASHAMSSDESQTLPTQTANGNGREALNSSAPSVDNTPSAVVPTATSTNSGELSEVRSSNETATEQVETNENFDSIAALYEFNNPYSEVESFLNPVNLNTITEDQAFIAIEDLSNNVHERQVARISDFVRANKQQIIDHLKESETPILLGMGSYKISLSEENPNELNIEYSDANAFGQILWENYDMIKSVEAISGALNEEGLITRMYNSQQAAETEIDAILNNANLTDIEKNQQIMAISERLNAEQAEIGERINQYSTMSTLGGLVADIAPISGSYRDLQRVKRETERGNFFNAGVNGLSFAATTFADAISFGTLGSSVRAGRLATKLADIARVFSTANRTFETTLNSYRAGRGIANVMDFAIKHHRKAFILGIGLDVGRMLLIPHTLNKDLTI